MSEALFLAYQNLGDYLSLSSWFPCFTLKKLLLQLREKSDKKRKQYENQTSSCFEYSSSSGWQRVHEDIMEMIVRRLSLRDQIRTGLACKSWNSVCMRGHIRGAQEAPWSLMPTSTIGDNSIFKKVLVMCRPGDKTWSGFQSELIRPHTIKFGDVEVELILVYDNEEWIASDIEYHNDYKISLNGEYESFLFESTNNEVLVIHQMRDVFEIRRSVDDEDDQELELELEGGNHQDDDDEEHNMQEENDDELEEGGTDYNDYQYFRTAGFKVYKIHPETGDFLREQSLGDQTLFLSFHGSFSLRASDFIELDKNNIYFATNGIDPFNVHKPFTTREIGIFCLDNERVERSFPSVQKSMGSRMSWSTPSLG
ncbi:unnamed protein product [Prunus armeniaca]|uniref:DUF295 domain-containing protein n=1 Tax=Prunus armeniaca TaxID=36596 RepID=A0A6J5VNG9_PRUAR|nr:unnamed protein product [Prunus armeniaca]